MPCYDERNSSEYIAKEYNKTIRKLEALLCGIFSAFSPQELDTHLSKVDWKEAGISKGYALDWWLEHQREDKARKKHEAEQKDKERIKQYALQKLNQAEREALGIISTAMKSYKRSKGK